MRILWIDDEIELLKPHIYSLKERGYEVDTATNGPDGLELVKKRDYDLVLLDEIMPGMDGIETLSAIRAESEDVLVAIVTKSEEEELVDSAFGKLADDFIIKPITPTQLGSAIKRLLERKKLVRDNMSREYTQELTRAEVAADWEGWVQAYRRDVRWELRFKRFGDEGLRGLGDEQREQMRREFSHFIEENYPRWLAEGTGPVLSPRVLSKHVFPLLGKGREVVFLLFDSIRLDQFLVLLPFFKEFFDSRVEYTCSILPTATPYSRNALFSGLYPQEIAERFPRYWVWDQHGQNRYEQELLTEHLKRERVSASMIYRKASRAQDAARDAESIVSRKEKFRVFVLNFLDVLIHSVKPKSILEELAPSDYALVDMTRSWFANSIFPPLLETLAERGVTVVLTTDHGFLRVQKPTIIKGGREISANLRYKYGPALTIDPKDAVSLSDPTTYKLPRFPRPTNFVIAKRDCYFIYPTKPREYEAQYKHTLQHGGISPEEMILPLGIFTPK
ncbi:MAG: bifunctional response regulator/alkaline phosphatase family protein [candidate division WOR-3 bacterium]|nr:bifunctional response regulator/alkaline phosphatase family protein [candidate division WOR-3 bacterium]